MSCEEHDRLAGRLGLRRAGARIPRPAPLRAASRLRHRRLPSKRILGAEFARNGGRMVLVEDVVPFSIAGLDRSLERNGATVTRDARLARW